MSSELDSYDLKLLAEVQKDARISQGELGKRVNLSIAAVSRRLKRLTEKGVIEKYTAVINPETLGYSLTIVTQVEVESERIDLLNAMKHSFQVCPWIQQCYYVTGKADFVLIFIVRHMAQYNELTQQLFFENNNVKRFETLVVMNQVKVGHLGALINTDREIISL